MVAETISINCSFIFHTKVKKIIESEAKKH